MTHQPTYIKWRDACFIYELEDVSELENKVLIYESVGFLLNDTSDCVTIVQDLGGDGRARGLTTIPTENIVEKRELK